MKELWFAIHSHTSHFCHLRLHIRTHGATQAHQWGRRDRELSLSTSAELEEAGTLQMWEWQNLPKQQVIGKAAFSATWVWKYNHVALMHTLHSVSPLQYAFRLIQKSDIKKIDKASFSYYHAKNRCICNMAREWPKQWFSKIKFSKQLNLFVPLIKEVQIIIRAPAKAPTKRQIYRCWFNTMS